MTDDGRLPLAQRLEALTLVALDQLGKILHAPNPRAGPNHIALSRVQADAAKTVLMAQIRVDEAKFRNHQTDNTQQILELVLKRKAELAAERALEVCRRERRFLDLDGDDGFEL
jgi:hypothetical protein